MKTDRRGFLKLGLGGSAALTAASALPGCSDYPSPPAPLKFFTGGEYSILSAIADTLIPAGGAYEPSASELKVVENLDVYFSEEDPQVQKDFKTALNLFEYGPIIFDLKFSRFTRLGVAEKEIHLAEWAYSAIGLRRTIYSAFKKAVMFAFYSDPSAWPGIGYEGPWK